jgi:DNA-binding MarR family transcriptional regulator
MQLANHLTRANTGFLLAKAMQRWNDLLEGGFRRNGYGFVRPSYGSILIPLFEEDGLRIGEVARRSKLSKQTMTTMVKLLQRDGLIKKIADQNDARAWRLFLTAKAKRFRPVAESVLSDIETCARVPASAREYQAVRQWLQRFAEL